MATVGSLLIDIAANTSSLKTGLNQARNDVKSFRSSVEGAMAGVSRSIAGAAAGFVSFNAVQSVFTGIVRATVESEQATAKLNAVIRATGQSAGLTAAQISDMADELAQNSLFDDEAVRNSAAVLATFRNIAGPTFREAMQAAVDLSTVMGQDLQSSVVQVGKALNDPIKGMTALQKIGVSLNATQRDQIRHFTQAGNVMGAQKVILQELAAEFGGAGAASTQGLAGSLHLAKMAWDEFLESVGKTAGFRTIVTETLQGWTDLMKASSIERESKNDPGWQITQQLTRFKAEARMIEQLVPKYMDDSRFEKFVKSRTDRWNQLQTLIAVAQMELKAFQRDAAPATGRPGPAGPSPEDLEAQEKRLKSVTDIIARLKEEAATLGMTDAQKLRYTLTTLKASDAVQREAASLREKIDAAARAAQGDELVKSLEKEVATFGMSAEAAKRWEVAHSDIPHTAQWVAMGLLQEAEALQQQKKAMDESTAAAKKRADHAKELVKGLQHEVDTFGMTAEAIRRVAIIRDENLAHTEQWVALGLLQQLEDLKQQAKVADEWKDAWRSAIEQSSQAFTDFFQRAFTEGAKLQDFLKGLLASIANVFASFAANKISSAAIKGLGLLGGAAAGGGGGGGGGIPAWDGGFNASIGGGTSASLAFAGASASSGPAVQVHQNVAFNIGFVDGNSGEQWLRSRGGTIAGIVGQAAREAPGYAQSIVANGLRRR